MTSLSAARENDERRLREIVDFNTRVNSSRFLVDQGEDAAQGNAAITVPRSRAHRKRKWLAAAGVVALVAVAVAVGVVVGGKSESDSSAPDRNGSTAAESGDRGDSGDSFVDGDDSPPKQEDGLPACDSSFVRAFNMLEGDLDAVQFSFQHNKGITSKQEAVSCCAAMDCEQAAVSTFACANGVVSYRMQCCNKGEKAPDECRGLEFTVDVDPREMKKTAALTMLNLDPQVAALAQASPSLVCSKNAFGGGLATCSSGSSADAPAPVTPGKKPPAPAPTVTPAPTAAATKPQENENGVPGVDSQGRMRDSMGVLRKLRWADEFDGPDLNENIWLKENGNGCLQGTCQGGVDWIINDGLCELGACGFGNQELQSYENANVYIEDGALVLMGLKEAAANGSPVTSGKVHSHDKYLIEYGRIEVRALLPKGRGAWPSIFMLPATSEYGAWPQSGEIDIMESFNAEYTDATSIMATAHFGYSQYPESLGAKGQNGCVLKNDAYSYADGEYHIFAVDWAPGFIKWYVDDLMYCMATQWWSGGALDNKLAPFDQKFELILNQAIGGNLPSTMYSDLIPDEAMPMLTKYDYVRVFDLNESEMTYDSSTDGGKVETPRPPFEDDAMPYNRLLTGEREPLLLSAGVSRINMELFDYGGEGVAYHDNDPLVNTGNSRLRPYDGVDVMEGNSFTCSDPTVECWKFIDSSGGSVLYDFGEFTAYTVNFPFEFNDMWIVMRHSSLTGAGFKIVANSVNCANPAIDGGFTVLDVSGGVNASWVPGVTEAAANFGIENFCWQTQAWGPEAITVPAPGVHKLVFCAMGDGLHVSYLDIMNFSPYLDPNFPPYGPGCNNA
jgi:beta-glucanase (GH16 family)